MTAEPRPGAEHAASANARLFSLTALCLLTLAVLAVVHQGYRALTDSFIAPLILSPDNDVVITNKLHANQMLAERSKITVELEAIDADLQSAERAMERLRALQVTLRKGLAWSTSVNQQLEASVIEELGTLERERQLLVARAAQQRIAVDRAIADLQAGLISGADLRHEEHDKAQLDLAILENERNQQQRRSSLYPLRLARTALQQRRGPATPEMIARDDQLVHLELEIMRIESDRRAKLAQQAIALDRAGKIDELIAQVRQRPIFRATERSLNVAFVPYTQMAGVSQGASVHECVVGLFLCRDVGRISELVPGEVVLPDPWGNQARGQYAILDLREPSAARSKTLRVRAIPEALWAAKGAPATAAETLAAVR